MIIYETCAENIFFSLFLHLKVFIWTVAAGSPANGDIASI